MEPDAPTHDDPKSVYPTQAQANDSWYAGDGDEMDIDLIDPALRDPYPPVTPNPRDPNASPSLSPPPPPPPPFPTPFPPTPQHPQPPQDQPRIPLEVMKRIEANVARVQAAINAMGPSQSQNQNQDAQNPPSTPPNRSIAPNPEGEQRNNVPSSPVDFTGILERLKKTLDNVPDDPPDLPPLTLPPRKRGILRVDDLFTLLRAAPPRVGCVIPNSERQIWYRPTQEDYVELNHNGVVDILQIYLDKPSYLTTYLTNACGFVQSFMYDQTQWCNCRYDPENTRFARGDETLGGNGTGALVVGYRTPWAPICNGCRGDRSVEVRVLDYLARWFSFPVPEGSDILDVMEAWEQAERFQQGGDVAGPWTPNGPPPEPEGQAEIELTAHSKALSRKFQGLLQGFSGGVLDGTNAGDVKSPTRKPKRRRYEGGDETGESHKRQRVVEKRHPLPGGPFLHDPFVDGASAGVPLSGGDPFEDAGGPMMLDDDDDWAPAAAPPPMPAAMGFPPPNSPNTPYVATANNNNNNNNNPLVPQRPQRPQGANSGGIPPRATAADAHARLTAEGKEYAEWAVDLPCGQHCINCKNVRMKPAKKNTKKCQKCVDTHAKIREINRERGYCTNTGCNRHMGTPRPLKANGEPFAYCLQCREKGKQKHQKRTKKGQGGGGGSEQGGGQAQAA
ncbi:hypothetical protein B0H65DRAFT_437053 [Neurospora tetraspora]|uniref:Uncharacterized protein n=1 Tax=Neurospora tetraspora TaxID=94610 RepID=A0AAE0J090_9PEZI|nr:hypothetical protein B0H65DRAFT_437053 [Neurospora tetraspora]